MTQSAKIRDSKGQEPSMEEILASIRRIIADDETTDAGVTDARMTDAEALREAPAMAASATNGASRAAAPAKAAGHSKPDSAPVPVSNRPVPNSQDDIDALLAGFDDAPASGAIEASPPQDDILELTEEMAIGAAFQQSVAAQVIEAVDDLEFTEAADDVVDAASTRRDDDARLDERGEPRSAQSYDFSAREAGGMPAASPMMAQATVSAVESAFNSLASTVLSNNARTLEDLVKEMLRPMLKSWLDDNLPTLVERIVRAEIERVSRGR